MENYRIKALFGAFFIMLGMLSAYGMTVVKARPQLSAETIKKVFEKKKRNEGFCKESDCKGEYFIHGDSEWGVCASQEVIGLSGTIKNMLGDVGAQSSERVIPMPDLSSDVIKDTFGFMTQFVREYNASEQTTSIVLPIAKEVASKIVEKIVKSYVPNTLEQTPYLRRLAHIVNGMIYFGFPDDIGSSIEKIINAEIEQDPEKATVQECFKLLNPDVQKKLFTDSVIEYLAPRIVKPKKVAIECEGEIMAVACSANGDTVFTAHSGGRSVDDQNKLKVKFTLWDMSNKDKAISVALEHDTSISIDNGIVRMACSGDGKMLLANELDAKRILLFDVRNRNDINYIELTPDGIEGRLLNAQFTQDGKNIIAIYDTGANASVIRWNIEDKSETLLATIPFIVNDIWMSGNRQKMLFYDLEQDKYYWVNMGDQNNVTIEDLKLSKSDSVIDWLYCDLNFDGTKLIIIRHTMMNYRRYNTFNLYVLDDKGIIYGVTNIQMPADSSLVGSAVLTPNGKKIICLLKDRTTKKQVIQLWDTELKRWVKEFVFDCNDNGLACSSDNCFISLRGGLGDSGFEKKATVWYFRLGEGAEMLNKLVLHDADQKLLLYQLQYNAKKRKIGKLSPEKAKTLAEFSSDEQAMIQNVLLAPAEPEFDEQVPAEQESYVQSVLRSLWEAAGRSAHYLSERNPFKGWLGQ